MEAFANYCFSLEALHLEDQATAVHLNKFGLALDGCAHRTGLQVLDVDGNAHGGIAFSDFVSNAFEASLFHQGNHGGGGKYFQCP